MGVYNTRMANQRAKDQQLLPFAAKRQFVSEMDAGLKEIGCGNRSQFIREAILEKLARAGVPIPKHLAGAPARTQSPPPESYALNDNPNSKIAKAVDAYAQTGKTVSYSKKRPAKKSAKRSSPAPSTPSSI
jgi:hypothetical protein